jgi:hypothetical protein
MIQLTTAAHCLAMLRSRQAVKAELQRRGLKLTEYSAAEITGWAHVFLNDHPELIPAARREAERMILSGVLGKRAQKPSQAFIKYPKIEQSRIERSQSNGEFIPARDCPNHC